MSESAVERVRVSGLVKAFPSANGSMHRAVDGLSFYVNAGEIYGLLGPNGAGKTTTLRILSGLMQPTDGQVTLSGVDVQHEPLKAKGLIGFLTANTGLYQRLSPRELLPYFAELNGMDREKAKRRVSELIELLGMQSFADLRCGALSTGQKQRTNIARALIADPPILIMDEPTLGLDVLTNRVILEFIRRERDAGKAIVLSTHYLDEAETLCDRIGLLHEGRLVAEGTMDELRARTGCMRLTDVFLALARPAPVDTRTVPREGDMERGRGGEGIVHPSPEIGDLKSDVADVTSDRADVTSVIVNRDPAIHVHPQFDARCNPQSVIPNPQSDAPPSDPEAHS